LGNHKHFVLSFTLLFLLHLSVLRLDVMEVDSAQLAEISREWLLSKDWWKLSFLGEPYLDKPHLTFWLSGLSMKIFGVNSPAYKLPSFLFSILAVYSTYRFSALYYSPAIARLAALITASLLSMFIAGNDVRSDSILIGAVMFSCWQMGAYFQSQKALSALLAGLGLGLAFSAKGPIGAIVPLFTFLPMLLKKQTFQSETLMKSLLLVAAGMLAAAPVMYAHYEQFGWQGIRFFLWKQSFGRITGESGWSNSPDTFFSLHTTAWACLPYTIFLLSGLLIKSRRLIENKRREREEYFSLCGFMLTLFALSLSKYQLPHYFYVSYPLAAVVAASSLEPLWAEKKWIRNIHFMLAFAAMIVVLLLTFYVFPSSRIAKTITCLAVSLLTFFAFHRASFFHIVLYPFLLLYAVLSFIFFPQLLKYQANTAIGKYLHARNITSREYSVYKHWRVYALSFESKTIPFVTEQPQTIIERISGERHYIITESKYLPELQEKFLVREVFRAADFPISQLSIHFLNPKTRKEQVKFLIILFVEGIRHEKTPYFVKKA
jgi:4-amino-4-deoxy-L-arabinose transferase-like glycosyltransferase